MDFYLHALDWKLGEIAGKHKRPPWGKTFLCGLTNQTQ